MDEPHGRGLCGDGILSDDHCALRTNVLGNGIQQRTLVVQLAAQNPRGLATMKSGN